MGIVRTQNKGTSSGKAVEACNWGRDVLESEEEEIIANFEAEGMTVTRLTDDEMEVFKEEMKETKQKFIEQYGADAVAAFNITVE